MKLWGKASPSPRKSPYRPQTAQPAHAPLYNDLSSPALSKTIICSTRGRIARLLPSTDPDSLLIEDGFRLMKIGTDGTLSENPMLEGLLVNDPPIAQKGAPSVTGPLQMALSADRRHFFLSGIFAASGDGSNRTGAEKTGFWRDGQVFKVDAASRKASVFFALPEKDVISNLDARGKSPIADFKYGTYAALQGVAADGEGRVFVCDRQNKRVLVLSGEGKIERELPVEYPDAIAVHPRSRILYVTTRTGHYHGKGKLKLLRFGDWSRDAAPSFVAVLCPVGTYDQATRLAVAEAGGKAYLWIAYTPLPVRVYLEKGDGLEPVKDFYEASPQRALDVQHIIADQTTGDVYVSDGWGNCFRVSDWKEPRFARCMQDEETPLKALSIAIEHRGRFLYGHSDRRPVARYRIEGGLFPPAPVGGSKDNAVTPTPFSNDWRIGLGFGDRGIAVAPDGSLLVLANPGAGPEYSGPLYFFRADPADAPWKPLHFSKLGKPRSGGARFDMKGNLYVGLYDGKSPDPPKGFEKDAAFAGCMGRIYKYAPTGSLKDGNLFPAEPAAPEKIYDVHYGSIGPQFARTPRFGVDGWGRIYYPTSLLPRVSIMDNEGNAILSFGTYGNRDSTGGLPGDLVPTSDVPMAWPNSVDATDEHVFVSDIVNIRILRLAKTFAASETAEIR